MAVGSDVVVISIATTVREKLWLTGAPMPLDAVNVIGKVPVTVGVPDRAPPTKVTPAGSVPLSPMVGDGLPEADGVNAPAVPLTNVVDMPDVKLGAVP